MNKMLGSSMLTKVLALVALGLFLCLPLAQIEDLVDERGRARQQAAEELARSHAGPQLLAGPILVVPYVERWTEQVLPADGKASRVAREQRGQHLLFPQRLAIEGTLAPQERYRGIFQVLFYVLGGTVQGSFPALDPAAVPRQHKDSVLELGAPVLALSMSDVRGLQGLPDLRLHGESAQLLPRVPGLEASWLGQGVHAPLPAAAAAAWGRGEPLRFDLTLALVGQERLAIVPLADDTRARLTSPWPHPSFGGDFLASRREVSATGFEAQWAVSSLVSSARARVLASYHQGAAPPDLQSFAVSLVEPVGVYTLSHRAVHYGALFVGLVLMAAFMFELFARLRLHPVQYGLVGLSIALFFLLLLALSEKLDFALAYALAAVASVALLTVYFSAVLRHWRRGVALGGYVGVLYLALFGLLRSEDNALLLGALLSFGLLALLMLATRRVDWYALSPQATTNERGAAPA